MKLCEIELSIETKVIDLTLVGPNMLEGFGGPNNWWQYWQSQPLCQAYEWNLCQIYGLLLANVWNNTAKCKEMKSSYTCLTRQKNAGIQLLNSGFNSSYGQSVSMLGCTWSAIMFRWVEHVKVTSKCYPKVFPAGHWIIMRWSLLFTSLVRGVNVLADWHVLVRGIFTYVKFLKCVKFFTLLYVTVKVCREWFRSRFLYFSFSLYISIHNIKGKQTVKWAHDKSPAGKGAPAFLVQQPCSCQNRKWMNKTGCFQRCPCRRWRGLAGAGEGQGVDSRGHFIHEQHRNLTLQTFSTAAPSMIRGMWLILPVCL